jgi:hypothetical protein
VSIGSLFRNERFLRVLRPAAAVLGIAAGVWHSTHAWSAYQQSKLYRSSDPSLADYFWSAFQTEAAVTAASFLAGVFAWQLFRVQRPRDVPEP